MRPATDRRGDQRGAALVLVLWVCVVVALLAAGFAATTGLEARRLSNQIDGAQARALIESGLAHGVMRALHPDPEQSWVADGRPYMVETGAAALTVRVWDEAGRLDLNRAEPEPLTAVLEGLLGPAGATLARDLLAGRDAGTTVTSVLELAGPDKLDPATFARLAPLVTVHSPLQPAGLSATAAPVELLRLWPGVAPGDADAALKRRDRPGTAWPEDLVRRLTAAGVTSGGTPSPVYTVRVEVALASPDGTPAARASAEAVLWIAVDGRSAYRILEWREPAPAYDLAADGSAAGPR